MNIKKSLKIIAAAITLIVSITGCASVKEYQKNKLNDADMAMGSRKVQKTEMNFQTYREGASGANGGKTGGGCGCN
jgi:PBP1b-binding outer membrane lipoprotein LpoB